MLLFAVLLLAITLLATPIAAQNTPPLTATPDWHCTTTSNPKHFSYQNCFYEPTCALRQVECRLYNAQIEQYEILSEDFCTKEVKPLTVKPNCPAEVICEQLQCHPNNGQCFVNFTTTPISMGCECSHDFTGERCDQCTGTVKTTTATTEEQKSDTPPTHQECSHNGSRQSIDQIIFDPLTGGFTTHQQCGCQCAALRNTSPHPTPLYSGLDCSCGLYYMGLELPPQVEMEALAKQNKLSMDQLLLKAYTQPASRQTLLKMLLIDMNLPTDIIHNTVPYIITEATAAEAAGGDGSDYNKMELIYNTAFLATTTTATAMTTPLHFYIALDTCKFAAYINATVPTPNDMQILDATATTAMAAMTAAEDLDAYITAWFDNPNAIIHNPQIFPPALSNALHFAQHDGPTLATVDPKDNPFAEFDNGGPTPPPPVSKMFQYTTAMWVSGLVSVYVVYAAFMVGIQTIIGYHRKTYVPAREQKRKEEFAKSYESYLRRNHVYDREAQLIVKKRTIKARSIPLVGLPGKGKVLTGGETPIKQQQQHQHHFVVTSTPTHARGVILFPHETSSTSSQTTLLPRHRPQQQSSQTMNPKTSAQNFKHSPPQVEMGLIIAQPEEGYIIAEQSTYGRTNTTTNNNTHENINSANTNTHDPHAATPSSSSRMTQCGPTSQPPSCYGPVEEDHAGEMREDVLDILSLDTAPSHHTAPRTPVDPFSPAPAENVVPTLNNNSSHTRSDFGHDDHFLTNHNTTAPTNPAINSSFVSQCYSYSHYQDQHPNQNHSQNQASQHHNNALPNTPNSTTRDENQDPQSANTAPRRLVDPTQFSQSPNSKALRPATPDGSEHRHPAPLESPRGRVRQPSPVSSIRH